MKSEGKGVTAGFIHGAKAAERSLPETSFPQVEMGQETCPGNLWGGDKPSPRCGERSAPQPSGQHLAASRRLWGTRWRRGWVSLGGLCQSGAGRGGSVGMGVKGVILGGKVPTLAAPGVFSGFQKTSRRGAPSVTVLCKNSGAVARGAGWLRLPSSMASCCQVTHFSVCQP